MHKRSITIKQTKIVTFFIIINLIIGLNCHKFKHMELNQNAEKNEVFCNNKKHIRKQELYNMIKCTLCNGLYRFAHTLVQCGHTFCQICIFDYIKRFKGKNPDIKCPMCHCLVQGNYGKSIIKDIFKQSLVDLIEPQHCEQEMMIAKRVQMLFPQFNVEFLLDEFKLPSFGIPKRVKKREQQNIMFNQLLEKIKQNFSITFQKFVQSIYDQNHFNTYLKIVKQKQNQMPKILQIKPKTERDFGYVGIKNQMKVLNLSALKLRRFLERKVLENAQQTGEFPKEWINSESQKLDIRVSLSVADKELDDNISINQIINSALGPITYSVN